GIARPLRVGPAVSLSGPLAPMGIDAHRGLVLWAEGPRPGSRRVELVVRDDRGDRVLVRRQVEELLVRARVDLLAGPYSSGLTRAAAPLAETHGVVLWNHGGAADDIHRRGYRMVVGIPTPASRYMLPALRWATGGPVVILHRAASGFSARSPVERRSRPRGRAGPCASSPIPRRVRGSRTSSAVCGQSAPASSWPPGGSPTTSRSPARSGAAGSSCRPRSSPRACAPSVRPSAPRPTASSARASGSRRRRWRPISGRRRTPSPAASGPASA